MVGTVRAVVALGAGITVLAAVVGCAQPAGPVESGRPDPAPIQTEEPDVSVPIDLATLPDRLTIPGRLSSVMAGEELEPRGAGSDRFWMFHVEGGFLPIQLRDEELAGHGFLGARGIVVAAPAGTELPAGDGRFAALEALAQQTGGALQVVGIWDGSLPAAG